MQNSCIHARHALRPVTGRGVILASTAQSESPTTQTNSATPSDQSAVPVVSDNAAAEVPEAEVASQKQLEAAQEKTQAGPSDVPTTVTASNGQPPQNGQSSQGTRSPPGRARQQKKPRTVEVSQLVPGAEFEGTIVSKPCLTAHQDASSIGWQMLSFCSAGAQKCSAADACFMRRFLSWRMVHLWILELSLMAWFTCHKWR